jgi:hypothetical protein
VTAAPIVRMIHLVPSGDIRIVRDGDKVSRTVRTWDAAIVIAKNLAGDGPIVQGLGRGRIR